ncbi:hypothetical protein L0666_14425 [Octadecabacter sp. CECT 8868]|uniref:hypothetical protein n=1 Tax=Octadecabacter algicola TaxID=2909342 RepID=UPI001F40E059|nr:hypothetical protein [Octadecabacter algicola]MCF2906188.1 hypothetical protein [Octadecabacter algicola]
MEQSNRHVIAALATLIVLQAIMLSALYAGIRPHPPIATPLFGIAPFLGAAISVALAAIIVQPLGSRAGRALSALAALMALVSFGPQKYFDAQFALIYPAVLLGQFAALVIFASVVKAVGPQQTTVAERV